MEANFTTRPSHPFLVDTKGLCFFCLRHATVRPTSSRLPMKLLLRYLKIDIYKLCHFSPQFLDFIGAIDEAQVEVSLCESCDHNINKFADLYKEMDMVRLQLDNTLQNVYEAVKDGCSDQRRLNEYRRRAHSQNVLEMFCTNFAENLRAETKLKCFQRMKNMVPRFNIQSEDAENAPSICTVVSTVSNSLSNKRRKPGPRSKTDPKMRMAFDKESSHNQSRKSNCDILHSQSQRTSPSSSKQGVSRDIRKNNGRNHTDTYGNDTPTVFKVEPVSALMGNDYCDQHNVDEDAFYVSNEAAPAPANILQLDQTKNEFEPLQNNNVEHNSRNEDSIADIKENVENCFNLVDENLNPFSCKICGKKFDKRTRLFGHQAMHSRYGSSTLTKTLINKKLKMKRLKRGKRYQCKLCQSFFYSFNNYKFHVASHASSAGEPAITTATASDKNNGSDGSKRIGSSRTKPATSYVMVQDEYSVSEQKCSCPHCKKKLNSPSVLNTHIRSKHPFAALKFQLPLGTTEDELNVAIRTAENAHKRDEMQKRYLCGYCNGSYPHPSHLRLHILWKHIDILVDIILKNKAINNGADEGFQLDDLLSNKAVEITMDQDVSILYDEESNSQEDLQELHDESSTQDGAGEAFETDGDNVGGNIEDEPESSIYISESFSLSNGK